MKRVQFHPSEQLKEVLDLIRTGQLYRLQEMIGEMKSEVLLCESIPARFSPLVRSVDSGFHSMVEVVLSIGSWGKESLNQALEAALGKKRWDLVGLIESQGASVADLDFVDVCRSVNPDLMERALRGGADPAKENAFAFALDEVRARPLLGFLRSMKDEYPVLIKQASLALSVAVKEKKARWPALLKWAGADPFMHVPYDLYGDWDVDESELGFTAAEEVCFTGDLALFKALNLRPDQDQSARLLRSAALGASLGIMEELLRRTPSLELNTGEPPSCPALEYLLAHYPEPSIYSHRYKEREDEALGCMMFLLGRGARWSPAFEEIATIRRNLVRLPPRSISKALRPIVHTPSAAPPSLLKELCRTPAIRGKILGCDRQLLVDIETIKA